MISCWERGDGLKILVILWWFHCPCHAMLLLIIIATTCRAFWIQTDPSILVSLLEVIGDHLLPGASRRLAVLYREKSNSLLVYLHKKSQEDNNLNMA